MLGIILLYFIGKTFYDLAVRYKRNPWGYTLLGVASYYAGIILAEVNYVLIYYLLEWGSIEELNDILLGLMAMPFGVLACWLTYRYLKEHFKAKKTQSDPNILDEDLM